MEWNVSSDLSHVCDYNQMNAAQISHVVFGNYHLQQFKKNNEIFKKRF